MDEDVELLLSGSLNVEHSFDNVSNSEGTSADGERSSVSFDPTCATSELLQNGIFVETKQGLVCLTLKEVLNSGLGGLNLCVEDLQHVAEQLIVQNAVVAGSNTSTGSMSEVSEVSEVELSAPEAKMAFQCLLSDDQPSCLTENFLGGEDHLAPLELDLAATVPNLQAERAEPVLPKSVQVPVSIARAKSLPESSQKKRGGWPKGRKRKPEATLRPPKAPATGYVLYLNEKRKLYKDIPFPDVTKLLGNEWSRMALEEKRTYLDRAEVDKKRYKQELLMYRKSDAYRSYLNEQRLKRLQGNGTEESDMDATDEIEEEDNEELYCRTCDQWFSTLHNKKEHLYGRQHLQSMSNEFSKKRATKKYEFPDAEGISSCSLDDSSLDGAQSPVAAVVLPSEAVSLASANEGSQRISSDPTYMDETMGNFFQIVMEREKEAALLESKVKSLNSERDALQQQLLQLQEQEAQLKAMQLAEQAHTSDLEAQLFTLVAVPALFLGNMEPSSVVTEASSNPIMCSVADSLSCEIPSPSISQSSVVLVLTEDIDMTDVTNLPDALLVS